VLPKDLKFRPEHCPELCPHKERSGTGTIQGSVLDKISARSAAESKCYRPEDQKSIPKNHKSGNTVQD
jgi:hypothetical protein